MLPFLSPVLLFALCTIWIFQSPSGILDAHPRLFCFMVGTAFANISVSHFLSPVPNQSSEEGEEQRSGTRLSAREVGPSVFSGIQACSLGQPGIDSQLKSCRTLTSLLWFSSLTVGLSFQCRLIVCQMSSTRCEPLNWLLLPLTLVILAVMSGLPSRTEILLLYLLTGFITLAHVHYGVRVVSVRGGSELQGGPLHPTNLFVRV